MILIFQNFEVGESDAAMDRLPSKCWSTDTSVASVGIPDDLSTIGSFIDDEFGRYVGVFVVSCDIVFIPNDGMTPSDFETRFGVVVNE